MSNPILIAGEPSLIAVLQAVQVLIANWPKPGALQVFLGTVEMQLPTLVASEVQALQSQATAKIAELIANLPKG